MEFKSVIDIFIFVLETCSDMEFLLESTDFSNSVMYTNRGWTQRQKVYRNDSIYSLNLRLEVSSNFDIEKVFYVCKLIDDFNKEHRKDSMVRLESLYILDDTAEIKEGYLEHMNIRILSLPSTIGKIPKLPESLEGIKMIILPEPSPQRVKVKWIEKGSKKPYPNGWVFNGNLFMKYDTKRELLDAISSGEIEL